MVEQRTSLSGQILTLFEQGYDAEQIYLEMKSRPGAGNLSKARVSEVLRRVTGKTADSRRLHEVYEIVLECLSLLREIVSASRQREAARKLKGIEKRIADATAPARPQNTA